MSKIQHTLNVKDQKGDAAPPKKWESSGISAATKTKHKIIFPNSTIGFLLHTLIKIT
jgi:hypothetical protein